MNNKNIPIMKSRPPHLCNYFECSDIDCKDCMFNSVSEFNIRRNAYAIIHQSLLKNLSK